MGEVLLARDAETGRIGTYLTNFTIPNLNRSVVLSSQRVPTADAIYNVKRKIATGTANPLISAAGKLIPSVTRVFSRGRELYVYLQAYELEASTIQPLVVFASFFQGDVKVLQTAPVAVTDGLEARSKAVPLTFNFSLANLPPGRYDCQITVLNPATQKVVFCRGADRRRPVRRGDMSALVIHSFTRQVFRPSGNISA